MSEALVGNCLHLYLQNYALLWSLEEQESLPAGLKEEEQLLASFIQRASDQAAGVLESLYSRIVAASAIPYRVQRRSQRRTVRDQWRMDGPLLRPREKMARNFWSLYLGCLRDKGPAACVIVAPNEPENASAVEGLAEQAAPILGVQSANARASFNHDSGYDCGIIVGLAAVTPGSTHETVGSEIKDGMDRFFAKYKAQFEQILDVA